MNALSLVKAKENSYRDVVVGGAKEEEEEEEEKFIVSRDGGERDKNDGG